MAKNTTKFKEGDTVVVSLSKNRVEQSDPALVVYLSRAPEAKRVGKIKHVALDCSGYIYRVEIQDIREAINRHIYCAAREISIRTPDPVQLCLF